MFLGRPVGVNLGGETGVFLGGRTGVVLGRALEFPVERGFLSVW